MAACHNRQNAKTKAKKKINKYPDNKQTHKIGIVLYSGLDTTPSLLVVQKDAGTKWK